jgi:branched-chain amino acid transport system ATP-binding protein
LSERVIEVEGLTSGYLPGVDVIIDASMTISQGELVVVLGPNGHGKTTLLRSLSGLVRSSAGRVRLDGQDITRAHGDRIAAAGMVHIPQGDLVFPEMSVEENLLMGAHVRAAWPHRSGALARVLELFPSLSDRRAEQAGSLSGGERRMLALGRGLMREAKLLMIDEPSLGLAPVIIEQVYERIAEIKASGQSILLADENADHVRDLGDRVLLLESGIFVREGTPAALLTDTALLTAYLG